MFGRSTASVVGGGVGARVGGEVVVPLAFEVEARLDFGRSGRCSGAGGGGSGGSDELSIGSIGVEVGCGVL